MVGNKINELKSDEVLLILCGGQAKRLGGRAKGLIHINGRPLLQILLENLSPLFRETVVLSKEPAYTNFPVTLLPDDTDGLGPLGALATAFRHIEAKRFFLTACDMPFVKPALVHHLLNINPEKPLVVPMVKGYPEPMLMRVDIEAKPFVERRLRSGDYRLISFFEDMPVCYVEESEIRKLDPRLESLINLNTPEAVAHHGGKIECGDY